MDVVLNLVKSFWNVFAMMAPWLVVGFFAAGVIAVWIPRSLVIRVMGGTSGWKGILRAVLIGVPLPICSCGVLPIATGLRKHGAGKGPTAAFLISTPQTGVDSILATYALMGPVFGAVACGIVVNLIPDALPSTMQSACCAAKDAPTLLQQAAAVFLAAMMAYDLVRPFGMAPASPVAPSAGRG